MMNSIPTYLADVAGVYAQDPREAARQWFRSAGMGLFLHYGLYSLTEKREWVQLIDTIPVAEYARLAEQFRADRFDADKITDLACEAGMKYVNLTTRHHDSFCLFETKHTDFHSLNTPAKRDLVGELSLACAKKGLGLCLYYSHGRDWRHPHAPNNDTWGGSARPAYDPPESSYAVADAHDLERYVVFMEEQITELLTGYGPIAAIWLDGIGVPLSDRRLEPWPQPPRRVENAPSFRCQDLYDRIHALQPQVLVSYKQGLLGTEDFFAPEHHALQLENNPPVEICSTLQEGSWGFSKRARTITMEEAWGKVLDARAAKANLLLNTGPLDNGDIDPEHATILREIGRRLHAGD